MHKQRWWLLALMIIILFVVGAYLAHQTNSKAKSAKITSVGSTALQPLIEAAVPGFQKQASTVNVVVQGGGSGTGLSQVASGAVEIGMSDVFAQQKSGIDASKLNDHIVAVTGIVPIVNPKLGVKNLSLTQLRAIFAGEITNWREVGGPDEPITVINRASGSGTRMAFEQLVMQGSKTTQAQEQDSNGTVKQIVANVPGAISYVSVAYVNSQVKVLKVNGVSATYSNITQGYWPIWSYEHLYTIKHPSQATKAFIKYVQSPTVQNNLVKKSHYVLIHDMQVQQDANGKITKISEDHHD